MIYVAFIKVYIVSCDRLIDYRAELCGTAKLAKLYCEAVLRSCTAELYCGAVLRSCTAELYCGAVLRSSTAGSYTSNLYFEAVLRSSTAHISKLYFEALRS